MINYSYSLTPILKRELEVIEQTRNKTLLVIISPREELRLQFEAMIERITHLKVDNHKYKKSEIVEFIGPQGKKPTNVSEKYIVGYKKAYDTINFNWLITANSVHTTTIAHLYELLGGKVQNLNLEEVKTILQFIQVNPENPIVQAGLAYFLIKNLDNSGTKFQELALLTALLFLYKNAFHFRGLLVLEEYIENDKVHLAKVQSEANNQKNLSEFLEYFVQAISIEAEKAYTKLSEKRFLLDIPDSLYDLTTRQKEILSHFSAPSTRITNRDVQKMFKISQITASRDLAKLSSLGFIFAAGKGRSVYYTRV